MCEKHCFVLLLFETEPNKFLGGEIISFLVWKFLLKCILKNVKCQENFFRKFREKMYFINERCQVLSVTTIFFFFRIYFLWSFRIFSHGKPIDFIFFIVFFFPQKQKVVSWEKIIFMCETEQNKFEKKLFSFLSVCFSLFWGGLKCQSFKPRG